VVAAVKYDPASIERRDGATLDRQFGFMPTFAFVWDSWCIVWYDASVNDYPRLDTHDN
jgi:hypothetical protein